MKINFALFSAAAASHFRAVSLQYKTTADSNKLEVRRQIGWRRAIDWDSDGYNGCERSDINTTEASFAEVRENISNIGAYGSYYTLTHMEDDPSVDINSHWCFGEKTFEIELNGVTSFEHDTVVECCTIPFMSDTGIYPPSVGGDFGYKATVNSVTNSSPKFDSPPIWVIMEGCRSQVYRVNYDDPEGDTVRCRWARSDEAFHMHHQSAIMRSFELNEDDCTVTYRPEFDQSGPGNKPLAIQVEDFDTDENLLHSTPSYFTIISFEPDTDDVRSSSKNKLYSGIFPDHDDEHDHTRKRRQTHVEPAYCHGAPRFVMDDVTDDQEEFFTFPSLFVPGRKRRTVDESDPRLITIPWAASYGVGDKTFYDFPRYQFIMPDGMECTAFDANGEAVCTWIPTPAQAIEGRHAHCAQIYDPFGRGSDRLCITIVIEIEPACEDGYQHAVSGDGLSVICADINECDDADACGDNASCENNDGGYSCICDDGFIKDDAGECVWPAMEYTDAVRTLQDWIAMTSDVLSDHSRLEKFTLRTGKLARNALNSIDSDCENAYNAEKYQSNDFSIWDRDHDRSDDYCTQTTQMKEGFQAFIDNYSCKDGKKAKQVKRVSKFIEKITNPYC